VVALSSWKGVLVGKLFGAQSLIAANLGSLLIVKYFVAFYS